MSFIINYINRHLMIHFSDIMNSAEIIITNDDSSELIKKVYVENKEFVNLKLNLKKGCYNIRIVSKTEENTKSIIVN